MQVVKIPSLKVLNRHVANMNTALRDLMELSSSVFSRLGDSLILQLREWKMNSSQHDSSK